ncbi:hypothetical protein LIER_01096 [Lithospermum erythrorhizon]|uniref:Uncharacterized protein n=1 Tax=Lithospermum erythrorhizon TaxID=34254 RepID=A0AAV3NK83_LITER
MYSFTLGWGLATLMRCWFDGTLEFWLLFFCVVVSSDMCEFLHLWGPLLLGDACTPRVVHSHLRWRSSRVNSLGVLPCLGIGATSLLDAIMASSSPCGERSPSPAYASSFELTPGRTPSPEYTPAATNHYIYRHRWVALCGHLHSRLVYQLRDMEHEIFEQLEADLEDDPEELLSHADRHLVDSVAARRSLERDQAPLFEIAVVAHRMEFYIGLVRALQALQQLLDREAAMVDYAFRSTATMGAHYSDLKDQLGARLGALKILFPF